MVAILVLDKIDFKFKIVIGDKGHYVLRKESIHQDIKSIKMYTLNRIYEAKIYIIERRNRQIYKTRLRPHYPTFNHGPTRMAIQKTVSKDVLKLESSYFAAEDSK